MNEKRPDNGHDVITQLAEFEATETELYNKFASIAGFADEEVDGDYDLEIRSGFAYTFKKHEPVAVERDGQSYQMVLAERTVRPFGQPRELPHITALMEVYSVGETEPTFFTYERPALRMERGEDDFLYAQVVDSVGLLTTDPALLSSEQQEYGDWLQLAYDTIERSLPDDESLL